MTEPSDREHQPFKDYYSVLHLHPAADAAMVDQVYWHFARLYNTEITHDLTAKVKLDELNEAYTVLRSPTFRREYDKLWLATYGRDDEYQAEEQVAEAKSTVDTLPPLAVMETQRPKAREKPESHAPRQPRLRLRLPSIRLRLPSVHLPAVHLDAVPFPRVTLSVSKNALGAGLIAVLATGVLIAGFSPVLVVVILLIGLGVLLMPLARRLPSMSGLPRPELSGLPTPRLPVRQESSTVDADKLRKSTEAMLERWRADLANRTARELEAAQPSTTTPVAPTDTDNVSE